MFGRQVELYGYEVGGHKSDKACETCKKYAQGAKKNGKPLTKEEKSFYKGASVGFLEYYNKHY